MHGLVQKEHVGLQNMNLSDTEWRIKNNLCEPGCLNCIALRKQCVLNNDFPICQTYQEYCSVNKEDEIKLLLDRAKEKISNGDKCYLDIITQAKHLKLTPEECKQLKRECNAGYNMNNMVACIRWVFPCDIEDEITSLIEGDHIDKFFKESRCSAMHLNKKDKKL